MASTVDSQLISGDSEDDVSYLNESKQITRSTAYWFDDGSVVFQAELTQFRVHRAILSRYSTVFRDMFEMPQPPHGEPVVEGCPVVELFDSALDIAEMLSSLYDREHDRRETFPFTHISALLKLGKKYDIEYQYKRALIYLQKEFPSTLSDWIRLKKNSDNIAVLKTIQSYPFIMFDVVSLALETNTLSILPAAYLFLCTAHDAKTVVEGNNARNGHPAKIPIHARLACLLGKDQLSKAAYQHTFAWVTIGGCISDNCRYPDACADVCREVAAWSWNKHNPLICFTGLKDFKFVDSLCANCQSDASAIHIKGRSAVWNELPGYFGLPSWEEIMR